MILLLPLPNQKTLGISITYRHLLLHRDRPTRWIEVSLVTHSDKIMQISAIVAISRNNVIGRDGHLPWRLSEDLKHFKAITTGHSVILGRKNYEDIGRPLPNRTNYVITRNHSFEAPGCTVCNSLELALNKADAAGETECFIIGGAAVYKEAMPYVTKMYVTWVENNVIEGDVFFPDWGEGLPTVNKIFTISLQNYLNLLTPRYKL